MKALLLDALGTLVKLHEPGPLLREQLRERFGIEVSDEEAGAAVAAEIEYYRAHLDEGFDEVSLADLRSRCAAALAGALPPRVAADALDRGELLQALLASLRFSAFDDAQPALQAARDRGARVVVVSNWDVSLHAVLARVGLSDLLDGVVTSAEVDARKPDARIFARGLALAGAAAHDAVHVGDSIDEDVAGARAAGITPVLLARDGSAGPPGVRTIGSLVELHT